MLRLRLRSALLFSVTVLSLAVSGQGVAQGLTTGSVLAVVTDSAGAPLEAVQVTLRDLSSGFGRSSETSHSGETTFPLLPVGEYELFAEQLGYRPQVSRRLVIRAGERLRVDVPLRLASGLVSEPDVTNADRSVRVGYQQSYGGWLSGSGIDALPRERRDLIDAARISSEVGADLEGQGLPSYLSSVFVAGLPAGGTLHPRLRRSDYRAAALPISAFESVDVVGDDPDVEWNEAGGLTLSAHLRRGTRSVQAAAFGDWSDAGLLSTGDGGAAPDAVGSRVGGWVSGPVIRDTANFSVGAEYLRLDARAPFRSYTGPAGSLIRETARDRYGLSEQEVSGAGGPAGSVASAFGRFDWQVAASHVLTLHSSFASLTSAPAGDLDGSWPGLPGSVSGSDALAGLSVASRLTRIFSQEVRVGFQSSRRDYDAGLRTQPGGLPPTRVVSDDFAFGADPRLPGRFRATTLRVSETLHAQIGSHQAKVGFAAGVSSYESADLAGRSGEFTFSDAEEFARGVGSYRQTLGRGATTSHEIPRVGLFVQDRWMVAPGLEVLGGLRFDAERIPSEKLAYNVTWFERTGLPDTVGTPVSVRVSPRAGFVWNVREQHRWIVHASAGIYSGGLDAGTLAELRGGDENVEVRRGLGPLGGWPVAPDSAVAPVIGPALALPSEGLSGPRSIRIGGGISGMLGARTSIRLSAVYRNTEFLPRRNDLNLITEPVAEDQYGRPLLGGLLQQGGTLGAVPGSNRRFSDFDAVAALNVDGWSDHRAVTLSVERSAGSWLSLLASYTYSETRDNWFGARSDDSERDFSPFPGTDWESGRSDFDLPHRAVVAAEARLASVRDARVSLLYRYRSGYPFTPGFKTGVDANADGSGANDPAFIDGRLEGMDRLLADWPCLAAHEGGFAERNSCRSPADHGVDARVTVPFLRLGGYSSDLLVEGLNLVGKRSLYPDQAVYLVDRGRALGVDASRGVVDVPLMANPGFGTPRYSTGSDRILRIGLRVNY